MLTPAGYDRPVSAEVEPRPESIQSQVGFIRAVYDRFAHLIHELGKFGVVGAICFGIDIGIFAACLLAMAWFPALVISTVIAATVAFAGNRYWTWRHSARGSLHREYGLYFSFNAVGLAISTTILLLTHDVLGSVWPLLRTDLADLIFGKVIGVGLASLFRFWAYRRFVFKPPTQADVTIDA